MHFLFRPCFSESVKTKRKERGFQLFEIVAEVMDKPVVRKFQNVPSQIRHEVVLPNLLAYFPCDDSPAFGYFLRFVLVEQLLQVKNRPVKLGCLQGRNEMIDDDR